MTHATKAKKSAVERRSAVIERTSGMFAHLAPGVSLADELVADRRAEVRAEEQADEAERRRASQTGNNRTQSDAEPLEQAETAWSCDRRMM